MSIIPGEEIGNRLEAKLLFLHMRHVAGVFEKHPFTTRHLVDIGLHNLQRRLVIFA
jgi:hypothetical protein